MDMYSYEFTCSDSPSSIDFWVPSIPEIKPRPRQCNVTKVLSSPNPNMFSFPSYMSPLRCQNPGSYRSDKGTGYGEIHLSVGVAQGQSIP